MKYVPQRSCIVCREQKDKSELLRITKDKDGNIALDVTGKAPGRGAYVCRCGGCVEMLIKKRVLNKAFKMQISDDVYASLDGQLKGFTDGQG